MAIPKYDEMMLPMLHLIKDGNEYAQRELAVLLADKFMLTESERAEMLPKVRVSRLRHRVGWAAFRLRRAGLAESLHTGTLRITAEGSQFLATNPSRLRASDLKQFPAWVAFLEETKKNADAESPDAVPGDGRPSETPEEVIEESYRLLRAQLASELLLKVRGGTSAFFEQLVVDLLLKMGYGGSRAEAGRATKPTGDNGIDGVIDEDRLGLDTVYVQAKKWEDSVGEPQLRDFVGALHAHRARKGVFMTTSEFSAPARKYVEKVEFKISLIDGRKLADLMIDFGVGVSLADTYEIKKIDSDYFEEA